MQSVDQKHHQDVVNISMEKLHLALDKYNYRIMSEDEYDETDDKILELKESIAEVGLINPITVRAVGHLELEGNELPYHPEFEYEVVAGHRRYIACKALGYTEIPCIIIEPDSDAKVYVIGLVENLQRNNMKPLEEAMGIKKYSEMFHVASIPELAKRVGKDVKFVRSRLLMLDLPEGVQEAINNKDISLKVAERITKSIINDNLRSDLFDFLITKKLTSVESDTLIQLAEDYEKSYRIMHDIREENLHHVSLRLSSMMKQHDIQFVEGYLRLKPETFSQRGRYSETTQTVKKLLTTGAKRGDGSFLSKEDKKWRKLNPKSHMMLIHSTLSDMQGLTFHQARQKIREYAVYKTSMIINYVVSKKLVLLDPDNTYILTEDGKAIMYYINMINKILG